MFRMALLFNDVNIMALSNNIGACLFYDLRHNCLHYIEDNDPMRDKISHRTI